MPTSYRPAMTSRWIAGIVGMLFGQAAWAFALGATMAGGSAGFAIIAAPVELLGWNFIWFDNGPPAGLEWLASNAFVYAFGLCFYGLLGALVGLFINRRRFSLRTLLIGTTLVSLFLGLAVYMTRK
jgi:hypothetical protein